MLLLKLLIIILLSFISFLDGAKKYIFSSVEHMKPLLQIEKQLLDISKSYLKEQKRKLAELLPFAKSVEEAMDLSAGKYEDEYLGHPLNAYLIIKRFTSGWKDIPSRLKDDEAILKQVSKFLSQNEEHLPSVVDSTGATTALLRLMDSHNMSAREISDGKMDALGQNSSYLFTARDALDVADIAHATQKFVHMKAWLLEAERLITNHSNTERHGNTSLAVVNNALAWSAYLSNDIKGALKYSNLAVKGDPKNGKFLQNNKFYSKMVEENIPITSHHVKYMKWSEDILEQELRSPDSKLCRNSGKNKVKKYGNIWNMRSFYKQDTPKLYLKPVKVTQLHDNPIILIFQDILTENHVNKLKDIALPRMKTATIVNPQLNIETTTFNRISKSMFLSPDFPEDKEITKELNPMFEELTGLDMATGEELQVNNYGIGGQYESHHDYGEPGTRIALDKNGNRVATLLIYLSNVEKGGETIFPELGLAISPQKGSGVFWYNLHRNGTGMYKTKHASCPMISGSKWVANKWIHERGNEFRRKCSLNRYH